MQLYGKSRRQEWLARYLLQVVFIIGEVSDGGMNGIDIEAIARDTIREIGYLQFLFLCFVLCAKRTVCFQLQDLLLCLFYT